ncbi:MAG: glycosyltransferase [Verrucomicrobia bacterium]|nr:glycosyltransferase [Verrucomicrobiota bacterium]
MKLVFVSNLFPDSRENYRGLDNATVLHQLSSECEIRVIAPRPRLPWKVPVVRTCRAMDAKFRPVYPEYFYVPKFGSSFNDHLFARTIRKPLFDLKRQFDFDVILVAWTFPDACAIARLAPELDVPFVAIVQGSDAHMYLEMPLRRKKIVGALSKASSVITRSAKLSHLLSDAGVPKKKLFPVYNGVDLRTFRPGNKQVTRRELGLADLPTILFVGNFLPVKNPFLLVKAHAQVCKEFRPCQLVMIGGGPLESEARELAIASSFGEHVVFTGRKEAAQVADYMQAADLLCLSSENEGVPNVILEAFAAGLPVISTDVGGISEVLNQPFLGKLVPRGDQDALVGALAGQLAKPSESGKIRQYGESFSWERAAGEYLRLLRDALR